MLDDGQLDTRANPQNPKRKLYRIAETSAEKSWTRDHTVKTKGLLSHCFRRGQTEAVLHYRLPGRSRRGQLLITLARQLLRKSSDRRDSTDCAHIVFVQVKGPSRGSSTSRCPLLCGTWVHTVDTWSMVHCNEK